MAKIDLISPGSIPNHTLKKNLKTNGNAIEHDSTSEHDILKTHAFVVAKKNTTGQVIFNPDEYQGGIAFEGETTFRKAGGLGHAVKISPDGTTYTGGRISISGTASADNASNEQVNGILEFSSSPFTSPGDGNTRALGGYIRSLTDGYNNLNTATPRTAGGILGISSYGSDVGAVGVKPPTTSGAWTANQTQTLTPTSATAVGGGASQGTGAQFEVVTDSSGNPRITIINNREIKPKLIASGSVGFNGTNHTITLSGIEQDWLSLGFIETGQALWARSKIAGALITISGAAESGNNGTFIIKYLTDTSGNVSDKPMMATVWNNTVEWNYADIPASPLTTESASSAVVKIYGGGSGINYKVDDTIVLTDGAGSGNTATFQVKFGTGDYPSYMTFGTCGSDASIASERMRISASGAVGIGTKSPQHFLSVMPTAYSAGWASQSGHVVTGYGTNWTSSLVGTVLVFGNGYYAGVVTEVDSTTSLKVSYITDDTFSAVDSNPDTIVDTEDPNNEYGPRFISSGFVKGMSITVTGSSEAGNNTTHIIDDVLKGFDEDNNVKFETLVLSSASSLTADPVGDTWAIGTTSTVNKQAYRLLYKGFQVTDEGNVIQIMNPASTTNQNNLGSDFNLGYTGVTAANQTVRNVGNNIDVNSSLTATGAALSINSAATIVNTGIDVGIASGTTGAQHAIGLNVDISGGAISNTSNCANNVGLQITQAGGTAAKMTVTGTAKSINETLVLTNDANASDMDGTGTAIKFNQWYYDASTPAIEEAARIVVAAEDDWTSDAATRDAYLAFEASQNGTLYERMRIEGSSGFVGIGTTNPSTMFHVERSMDASQFQLGYDSNHKMNIQVFDDGKTTLRTFGDGTTDSDLTLNIDGDIDLQAAGGDITFKGASDAALATINSDGLTLNNIGTDAAGDNYLVEVSGLVKKRTPAETLADIGAIPTANLLDQDDLGDDDASKPASQQSIKAYVDAVNTSLGAALATRLNNNTDDTFEGTLTIDKDTSFTTSTTSTGIHVDLDHTGIMGASQTGTFIGANIDINTDSPSHHAYSSTDSYGLDIALTADTDGSANKNTGINILCTGGDASHTYGIKSNVTDGGTDIALYSSADSGDYCTIATTTHGATTITTVDDNAAAANLTLDIHGDIILDAHSGAFLAKKAGTEFSVANSAYAGMILGYTTVGIDSADASYSLTTTMTVIDDAMKVKFKAPPSGAVEISVSIYADPSRRHITLGLSDQNTGDTYQAISFPNSQDATNEHKVLAPPSSGQDMMIHHKWVITGLTAGTAYEWWLGAKCLLGNGGSLRWGGDVTNEYGPFIMKATALPTAVTDYAVYG